MNGRYGSGREGFRDGAGHSDMRLTLNPYRPPLQPEGVRARRRCDGAPSRQTLLLLLAWW
ncbi:MAG: hypothetical protein U0232_12595 [Thermomicrobiales bacterium]